MSSDYLQKQVKEIILFFHPQVTEQRKMVRYVFYFTAEQKTGKGSGNKKGVVLGFLPPCDNWKAYCKELKNRPEPISFQ